MDGFWRKCSSCKKDLGFNSKYWACNVSTCNRSRTFFAFCSVSCWDAHLGFMNHRESWAEEKESPSRDFWKLVLDGKELWPPRPKKEIPEDPLPSVGQKPKVLLRKKS